MEVVTVDGEPVTTPALAGSGHPAVHYLRRAGLPFGEACATAVRAAASTAASILSLRLPRVAWLTARHAAAAGRSREFGATLPVVLAGHQISLLGEAVGYDRWAVSRGGQL